MKILIAEDNLFSRIALEATLTEWGYEVAAAEDGARAWDILQEPDAPRLAIIDWMMPGLDGIELCRRVRAAKRASPTYLILLTARGDKQDIVTGLQAGADDYLTKPFDREELRARLQVGLRIVGLQSELARRVQDLEHALSGAQKLETIGRLAGGVAHDFNNLLTVILGSTDFLLNDPQLQDWQRDMVGMIRQSGERGAALTRQLLAFSRRQILVPQVLPLNGLIGEMAKLLRVLVGESVRLVLDLKAAPDLIEADGGQIEQVLLNRAVNARDAMPSGGTLTISTANAEPSDPGPAGTAGTRPQVVLAVADTGCGMDDAVQAHLFEPFFTTKQPGHGTGLGLATVYGVVRQSGGSIRVQSAVGRGTTFFIHLPGVVKRVAADEAPRPAPPGEGKETVLLVEDEDTVRVMARKALQMSRYQVLEARDGSDALGVSGKWPGTIDLLVTDVVMPRLGGRQLADCLATLRPSMKVLYMSGYIDDAVIRESILETGKPFLQKPFTPSLLTRKVREVLDQPLTPDPS
jgi:two-component system cell cycle sensor histidine kinase/response regulator CckA